MDIVDYMIKMLRNKEITNMIQSPILPGDWILIKAVKRTGLLHDGRGHIRFC